MKYKIGDKVKLKRTIKADSYYNGIIFTSEMLKLKGKILTITDHFDNYKFTLSLNDTKLGFVFTEDMLSDILYNKEDVRDLTNTISKEEVCTLSYGDRDVIGRYVPEEIAIYNGSRGFESFTYQFGMHDLSNNELSFRTTCNYGFWETLGMKPKRVELNKIKSKDTFGCSRYTEDWFKGNKILSLYKYQSFSTIVNSDDEVYYLLDIDDKKVLLNESENKIIVVENYEYKKHFVIDDEKQEQLKIEGIEEITNLSNEVKELTKQIKQRDPFQKAMTEAIIEKGKEIATKDLEERIKVNLDKYIEDNYGILPKVIKVQKEDTERTLKGIFHKKFETICKIVEKGVPLMLVGSAGSGKNHTLYQVSEALELEFYTTGAITQEYKLTGFIDANGVYHETEFYKAFTKGGLFFLDEIDASTSEVLVILNGAIANGYFDFPTGRENAHENFRVVCAGNTYGTGADMIYVGRNVLDGATLDRFVVVNFDYDKEVERQLAYDEELFNFIQDLRKAVNESNLRYIVGMRCLINATKLLEIGLSKREILQSAIIKNMQKDDLNTIVNKIDKTTEWGKVLKGMTDYV